MPNTQSPLEGTSVTVKTAGVSGMCICGDGSGGVGVWGSGINQGTSVSYGIYGVTGLAAGPGSEVALPGQPGGPPALQSGAGVYGFSVAGTGVYGASTSGWGVAGISTDADAINGTSASAQHAGVSANNTGAGYGLWANSPNGTAIYGQGKVAGVFHGDVEITGTLRVDVDIIMTAADFAEDFAVWASESIEPGTVMVLDGNGTLRPCDGAYDRKVAGVTSGAGDYRPGLILDRQKSSEHRLPIALVGKVYCKVDAGYGAVEVGDLLTTSATHGHAMKAHDPLAAFGAVLGKALGSLRSGQGLVPMLVTLQ